MPSAAQAQTVSGDWSHVGLTAWRWPLAPAPWPCCRSEEAKETCSASAFSRLQIISWYYRPVILCDFCRQWLALIFFFSPRFIKPVSGYSIRFANFLHATCEWHYSEIRMKKRWEFISPCLDCPVNSQLGGILNSEATGSSNDFFLHHERISELAAKAY